MPTCMTCSLNKCILKILKIQFKVEAIFLHFEYYNHCEQLRAPFILIYIFFTANQYFAVFFSFSVFQNFFLNPLFQPVQYVILYPLPVFIWFQKQRMVKPFVNLDFFVLTLGLVVQHLGSLDVTNGISISVERQEWKLNGLHSLLYFLHALDPSRSPLHSDIRMHHRVLFISLDLLFVS